MTTMMKKFGLPALRIALLGACAACAAAPMLAQDAPPPPPSAGAGQGHNGGGEGRMLKHMTKELNLTPDQVSQIQAIQSDEAAKMQALNADSSDPSTRKQKKAIREDGVSRTRAVLTDEQKPKFDAMLAQQKERQQEHRQGGAPPPSPSDAPPPSL